MKKFLATLIVALIPMSLFAGEINMTGTGSVSLPADTAYVTVAVTTTAIKPADAMAMNADSTNRIFTSLDLLGVKKKEIQTQGLRLQPKYNYVEKQEPKLVGYTVSHTLQVTVCNIADTGKIMDAVVKDGANSIERVSFSISEEKRADALKVARKQAVQAAIDKADLYCNALGIKDKTFRNLTEHTDNYGGPKVYYSMAPGGPGGRADTNIEGGQIQISVSVSVSWEVK